MVSGAFALNGVLAVAGLYLAFALFPGKRRAGPAPPPDGPDDPVERTRKAAVAALVMLPPFTLLLTLNLTSAMRILFTIAVVLASLNRRDVRETGIESVLSALFGAWRRWPTRVLYAFWPEPAPRCSPWRSSGFWSCPTPSRGRTGAPWRWRCRLSGCCSALPARRRRRRRWSGASTRWGVVYAIWARALVLSLLGWSGALGVEPS